MEDLWQSFRARVCRHWSCGRKARLMKNSLSIRPHAGYIYSYLKPGMWRNETKLGDQE
ncbi:hypothetical protein JOB18_044498 [Solea senegalensis]|uniref:Uncharacterized protein n=1 Tax=Solea senegalensis TaxID=28829 RepID=A0AAV6SE02_SOLSE|nr:hypothetical protein JOB18_044498 [Solea senegalensis]